MIVAKKRFFDEGITFSNTVFLLQILNGLKTCVAYARGLIPII